MRMNPQKDNGSRTVSGGLIGKLFGRIAMTWPRVIALAVITAALSALFLLVPLFKNTSFERMGVYLEAWFFFAILIMANCRKPLESALKTFVFFLVSQPLIYLIQVPFSSMGWGLFGYYRYWFLMTLPTFPMAFVGWYITKRNWLSVVILAPVLAFMGITAYQAFAHTLRHFPLLLLTALTCVGQIVIYVIAFFPDVRQKIAGFLVPAAAVIVLLLTTPQVDVRATVFLPGDQELTEYAVIAQEDETVAQISLVSTGESSMILVHATRYGSVDFAVRDGENTYFYTAQIYDDEGGHSQVRITERQPVQQ